MGRSVENDIPWSFDVAVVGLGTVGVPELHLWHKVSDSVVGYDIDDSRIKGLAIRSWAGRIPILSTDIDDVRGSRIIVLCLPTSTADGRVSTAAFDHFEATFRSSSTPATELLIIASTVPVGFSREMSRRLGVDNVAHAPERYDPGRSRLEDIPRLVGATNAPALAKTAAFYRLAGTQVHEVQSPEVAETAKLFENAFRLVSIALVNELATICQRAGVSTRQVIDAAATKPFGFLPHYPGAGAGGVCIPVVPQLLVDLAHSVRSDMPLLRAALLANDTLADTIVRNLKDVLGPHSDRRTVLVVGATYKADYPDVRGSAACRLIERLARDYEVTVLDPLIDSADLPGGVEHWRSVQVNRLFDLVVIAVPHAGLATQADHLAPKVLDLPRGEVRVAGDRAIPD